MDVEAEVDDEDEEVDDEEDDVGADLIADRHPEDEELDARAAADEGRHRALDREREKADDIDAHDLAKALRERHGRKPAATMGSVVVPQRLLLPTVDDPTIWGVQCLPGKEKEIVFSITKRIMDQQETPHPLNIISVLERGSSKMPGYVYIEARRRADVLQALEGVMGIRSSRPVFRVEIEEMPDLLRATKTKQLEPGMYVRVKRGLYQGDLAQVDEVDSNGVDVVLRVVPRLDYGANEDQGAAPNAVQKNNRFGFARKNAQNRPPPRLFSDYEAKKRHSRFLTQQSSYNSREFSYLGDQYVGGFLIKTMKNSHLITENVNPTLEEVARFSAGAEDGAENLDLNALAATLKTGQAAAAFVPGDSIEIYQGEQRGVVGKIDKVQEDIVTLKVTEGELNGQVIDAHVKTLRKRFRAGDHVRVVGSSKYADESGMVVRVKDDRVTLLSDSSNAELTVFSKDLRAAADAVIQHTSVRHQLFDMVQLE